MKEVIDIQNQKTDEILVQIVGLAVHMKQTNDLTIGLSIIREYKKLLQHNGMDLQQFMDILDDL